MRSIFIKCVVIALLGALLVTAIPMTWAAGGGSAAGTTGGVGRGTESGAPPAADSGRNVGTGVTGGEVRDRGMGPAHGGEVGERRVDERRVDERRGGDRGFVGGPAGGVVVYSLTVYNGDQAACYNSCVASGQYPPDQCQYMCTQW